MKSTHKIILAATLVSLTSFMNSAVAAGGHGSKEATTWDMQSWNATLENMPTGNATKGQLLASEGYCYSCHGVGGNNSTQSTPSLAGQNKVYLYKMLIDYKDGRFNIDKKSGVMIHLSQLYSPQDMADMAVYFSEQPVTRTTYQTSLSPETAKIIKSGDVNRMLVPCASCHGAKGEGGYNEVPALKGMSPRMFIRHMHAYRAGTRHNDVNHSMSQFARNLTDAEIDALAHYYANLK